jgi:hypothetical protein
MPPSFGIIRMYRNGRERERDEGYYYKNRKKNIYSFLYTTLFY